MPVVIRPSLGRALTVTIAIVGIVMTVSAGTRGGWSSAAMMLPWAALLVGACWATFWRPHVAVSDGGVRLVNVTRTIDVAWPALVDIDTKWALTLVTAYGRFTAWSAPAPGARRAVRSLVTAHDLAPTDNDGTLGPGELIDSASGSAAAVVRERWNELRAAGHLDAPQLERERADVHWHVGTAVVGAALVVLAVVTVA